MRRRYYIFIVTHDWDGQLKRIPIPVHWVMVFVACAAIGALTLAGLAGSYGRMLSKVQSFNQMRQRQDEQLATQLLSARKDADQFRAEVASLGSLASEVSSLYNFKHNSSLKERIKDSTPEAADTVTPSGAVGDPLSLYDATLNNFQVLETTALQNTLPNAAWSPFGEGVWRPSLWPVEGRITSSFGERLSPFEGEGGEFHAGLDIAAPYGSPVHSTADGTVSFAGIMNGYGRVVVVVHGHGVRTLYAHLSSMAVTAGQHLNRQDVLGFVGTSGLSTGAHVHYEVQINGAAVNPYPYLH